MKYFTKNRIKNILIIFLLISNIATIGSILFHRWSYIHKHKHPHEEERQLEQFINDEMGFSSEQMNRFQTDKKSYLEHKDSLFKDLQKYRTNMWKEYASPTPNKQKLDSLAVKISENFLFLNKSNNEHYLNLLNICDSSQKIKLKDKFKKMIEEKAREEKERRERPHK